MQTKSLLPPLSLYIHIPWCIKKCPYCDFNSHALKADTPETQYIDALLADFHHDLERFAIDRPLQTLFIGGGTPSLFSPQSIDRLLNGINRAIPWSGDIEMTLEANPGTFESSKFKAYRQTGINRLSIGIQSFNDAQLQQLGRVHSANEALRAVTIAQQAGFDNINLDLMFGLPGIKGHDSYQDLLTAIQLQTTHISFYQLTLEPNTYFNKFPPQLPDDESIFASQMQCQQLLAEHGFEQYEISAYSRPQLQSRHNMNYWQFGDYLGIGAGAHGKISQSIPDVIYRTVKPKSPEQYLKNPQSDQLTVLKKRELPFEFVMNHLRLKRGFTMQHYLHYTGLPEATLLPALTACIDQGLLRQQNGHYLCSERGWNFLDSILEQFIGEPA